MHSRYLAWVCHQVVFLWKWQRFVKWDEATNWNHVKIYLHSVNIWRRFQIAFPYSNVSFSFVNWYISVRLPLHSSEYYPSCRCTVQCVPLKNGGQFICLFSASTPVCCPCLSTVLCSSHIVLLCHLVPNVSHDCKGSFTQAVCWLATWLASTPRIVDMFTCSLPRATCESSWPIDGEAWYYIVSVDWQFDGADI